MDNAFSRLAKVVSLERKQGFRNKAVIGGLDKFATRWEPDARAESTNQAAVDQIVALLIGYPSVSEQSTRERIVDQVMRRLRDLGAPVPEHGGQAAVSPVSPRDEPRPAGTIRDTALSPDSSPAEALSQADAALRQSEPAPPAAAPAPDAGDQAAAAPRRPERPAPEAVRREVAPQRPMPARSKPESAGASRSEPRAAQPASSPRPQAVTPSVDDLASLFAAGAEDELAPTQQAGRPAEPDDSTPLADRDYMAPTPRRAGQGLDAPVVRLPSIGPGYADKLAHLGVYTVRELLFLLPRRYEDYSLLRTIDKLRYGEEVTVIATIWNVDSRAIGPNRKLTTAVIGDGTGQMEITWFNPYIERQLRSGRPYVFSGKIDSRRGRLLMTEPEFEPLEKEQLHTARLVPVYPLTEGISSRWLRERLRHALSAFAEGVGDLVPEPVRQRFNLLPRPIALTQVHFPDNQQMLAAARRRLSFDEFLIFQLGMLRQRQAFRGQTARALRSDPATLAPFLSSLPFEMTAAQRRVLEEISADLTASQPMSRLLQGDVGSGKTAVAAAALWAAVASGLQGAIMAPTEILAEQHARSFEALFAGLTRPADDRAVRVALLSGRLHRAEREDLLAALAAGDIDVLVGTHALIQGDVAYHNLGLAVVDEQHRFGVEQRAALRQKGMQPHMLVMSATPIPRSLALTVYGDLDVSVIDEMPAGRTPIKTKWLAPAQCERAYDFIKRQVQEGRQAFIVYPLVETSERSEAKAAVEEHERLQKHIFPNLKLGLLHGRLKSEDKDAVMRAFAAGDLNILVATSVVEVGIDVPNATVIMIEGAERFGLAQLHQFRGRVGRGEHASYCILVSDATDGEGAQRLVALETSNDGFTLAQVDLEMRGPGDFLGTRQSGLPPLFMGQLSDLRTLEQARQAAQQIFADDPSLARPEHTALAAEVAAFWRDAADIS